LNRKLLLALASLVALAGCANLRAADCGSDWQEVGERDGILGAQPRADLYAARCTDVDAVRYREGWQEGFGRRPYPPASLPGAPSVGS
jgi:hypothetical protein